MRRALLPLTAALLGASLSFGCNCGLLTTGPAVSIDDVALEEGAPGTTSFAFTVSLDSAPAPGRDAHVGWATHDGTATAGSDYRTASGELVFKSGGALAQSIVVEVVGDTTLEPDETFSVVLEAPVNATLAKATGTGTIVSDDAPRLSIADASILEGNAGTTALSFTVSLDTEPAPGKPLQVDWATAGGTATAGTDYEASSGSLTFAAGEGLTKTISVLVLGDTSVEPSERFTVTLANPVNATLATSTARGTILPDDFPAVSVDSVSQLEGDAGTTSFVFTVSLSAEPPAGLPLTVQWATADGTATAGSDYNSASGQLTFAQGGSLTQTVTVYATGDTALEPDETFAIGLTVVSNGVLGAGTGTGTLVADDFPTVSIGSYSHAEGNTGTTSFDFAVSLSADPPAGLPLTVHWATADGTAKAGSDYTAAAGDLTFSPGGALTQTVSVLVTGDVDVEPDETFYVSLSAAGNGTLGTGVGTGTLLADEGPGVSVGDASLLEGNSGTQALRFTVTIDADPAAGQDVQVNWATGDGTATAPADYLSASGTLTFVHGGSLSQTATVDGVGDTSIEPDETFTVTLSGVVNGRLGRSPATGTLLADDFPTASIAGVSANEGNSGYTPFNFVVTLSAPLPAGYTGTVDYATADGTALAASDYVAKSGTLTFTPGGGTAQTLTVSVLGDTRQEDDETFTVALSNPSHLVLTGGPATGTIVSDDLPEASAGDVTVVEGDSGSTMAVFNVALKGQPLSGRDAQLTWATADGTASKPTDYAPSSGSLTFALGGPLTQTVSVPVYGDTVFERDEIFSVKLTAVANVALGDAVGFATLVDDELPSLTIDDVTRSEGNSGTTPFTFTISISRLPELGKDVHVDVATVARTALAGSDYTATSGSLTFTSGGPSTVTLTVDVLGDTTIESQEEFAVVLSNVTNARIRDDTGLGTLVDDDGARLYVDPTSTAGTLDGLGWATAFHTVQDGVDRAYALGGGQVWVAAATYTSTGGTATVLTLRSRVAVAGGFGGYQGGTGPQESSYGQRDPDANVTILDGAGQAYHVLIGASEAVLDGFTVTGGRANSTASTSSTDPNRRGAGMDLNGVSPTIARCTFTNNVALGWGGALYITRGTAPSNPRPVIHDSRFINNTGAQGGAFYSGTADVDVLDSVFESNTASGDPDGYGGAFEDNSGHGTINRSRFAYNFSFYGGGGEGVWSYLTLRNCDFVNNRVYNSWWGMGQGAGFYDNWGNTRIFDSAFMNNVAQGSGTAGGLYLRDSNTLVVRSRVENNVASNGAGVFNWNYFGGVQHFYQTRIANNRASSNGGGVSNQQSAPVFVDCVIEGNTALGKGGGMYTLGASPKIVSSTLFNNLSQSGPELYNGVLSGTTPIYSSVTATNTILFNRTLTGLPSVVNEGGCSLTTTNVSRTDSGEDAQFVHIPLRTNWLISGTTTTLNVTNASTYFAVGDVVEVGDDGVPRLVTAATATQLTLSPALDANPSQFSRVDNWGPGATDVAVDLRLAAGSPCIDSGSNPAMLPTGADLGDLDGDADTAEAVPYDYAGNLRFIDDPLATDTGVGPAPIVDLGALERVP